MASTTTTSAPDPNIALISPSTSTWTVDTDVAFEVNVTTEDADAYAFIDWDDSLVGWWRAEGNANDSSQYGNHGTLGSGASANAVGKFGTAFTGGTMSVGNQDALNFSRHDSFTVACWVKKSRDDQHDRFLGNRTSWAQEGWDLYWHGSNKAWQLMLGPDDQNRLLVYNDSDVVGRWVHVALVFDGSDTQTASFYVDGTLRSSGSVATIGLIQNALSLRIFASVQDVDEVIIFNRVLAAAEIAALHDATAANLQTTFTDCSELTEYDYTVWAVNSSGDTDSVSGSILVDSTDSAPAVTITPNTPYRSSTTTQTFSVSASSTNTGVALASAQLYWDHDQVWGPIGDPVAMTGSSDVASWEKSGLSGTITWNVLVTDADGNEGWGSSNHVLYVGQDEWYISPTGTGVGTAEDPMSLSAFAAMAIAGDTGILAAGTYRETVTPTNSGNATAPITYKAADGATVTISGADIIDGGWTAHSGNIYKTSAMNWDMGLGLNQLFVNGTSMMEARWPNPSDHYWQSLTWADPNICRVDSGSISGSSLVINSTDLTGDPNDWEGAIVHVNFDYCGASAIVTSSGEGYLTATLHTSTSRSVLYNASVHFFYIAGNSYNALDMATEWYYDYDGTIGDPGTLYFWAPGNVDPGTLTVEAKARNYAFDLDSKSYISIDGLHLLGCNITTDYDSSHILLDGLDVKYPTHFTVLDSARTDTGGQQKRSAGIVLGGQHNTIQNSQIDWSAGNGVSLVGSYNQVLNCEISNIAYTHNGGYAVHTGEIVTVGNQITSNTISKVARGCIHMNNIREGKILYNDLSYTRYSGAGTYDLGAIYAIGTDGKDTEIAYNTIHEIREIGIYLDNVNSNFNIHHNVVWNWGYVDGLTYASGNRNALHMNQSSTGHTIAHNTFVGGRISTNRIGTDPLSMAGTQIANNILAAFATSGSALFTGYADSSDDAELSNNIVTGTAEADWPYSDETLLYADYEAEDFSITTASPAYGAGTDMGYTEDILGNTMNSPPDVGAYQDSSASSTTSSTTSSTSSTSSSSSSTSSTASTSSTTSSTSSTASTSSTSSSTSSTASTSSTSSSTSSTSSTASTSSTSSSTSSTASTSSTSSSTSSTASTSSTSSSTSSTTSSSSTSSSTASSTSSTTSTSSSTSSSTSTSSTSSTTTTAPWEIFEYDVRIYEARTGDTLYIVRYNSDDEVYLSDGSSAEAWGAGGHDASDYYVPMAEYGSTGDFGAQFDASGNIPAGMYRIEAYLQLGANPADSDSLLVIDEIAWDGTKEITRYALWRRANHSVGPWI